MTSPFTDSQLQEMAFQSDPTGAIAGELLETRRDARRYRWLRGEAMFDPELDISEGPGWDIRVLGERDLEAAIDAAIAEGK